METLIKMFALVDLAIIGLIGMITAYRMLPRRAIQPLATRKEEKQTDTVRSERSQVGDIEE